VTRFLMPTSQQTASRTIPAPRVFWPSVAMPEFGLKSWCVMTPSPSSARSSASRPRSASGSLQNFLRLSLRTFPFQGEAGTTWLSGWTTYYWGWWMSWAPFVGVFIARSSRVGPCASSSPGSALGEHGRFLRRRSRLRQEAIVEAVVDKLDTESLTEADREPAR
jgi:hypothetical protein